MGKLTAPTYADMLVAQGAWFAAEYGAIGDVPRVPGDMGADLLGYWEQQFMVAQLSRGPAAITTPPPGGADEVIAAFDAAKATWPATDPATQPLGPTEALWDAAGAVADWADQHSKTGPQSITLTAPSTSKVPPPFGKKKPPPGKRRGSKPGPAGWLMLAAIWLATRRR